MVVYFQINLKGLRLNILSHLFDSLDHGNFFFFKINQRGRSFLKTSSLPFSRCKSLASRFLTGRIGAPMLSYERSWLYPSSKKKTSGRSSSASSKQQTPHLFASSPTMYRAPGSKATPGRHPLGQSLCSRSGPTMTWKRRKEGKLN